MRNEDLGFPLDVTMWVDDVGKAEPSDFHGYYLKLAAGRYGANGGRVRIKVQDNGGGYPVPEPGQCVLIRISGEETTHRYHESTGP